MEDSDILEEEINNEIDADEDEYESDTSGGSSYAVPIAIVIAGVIIGVAIMMSGGGTPTTTPTANTGSATGQQAAADVSVDDDPALGDPDAPITVIEFSDFQCPFCRQFWTNTFEQIKRDYIDTGKVRFVYRDFPLASIHPMAQKTAEAAECADDQGLFWEAHDAIFTGQAATGQQGTVNYSEEDVYGWLNRVPGLDVDAVRSCVANGTHTQEVQNDFNDARSAGIQGTPGFVVNGRVVSGALPYEAFAQLLDSLLTE